AVHKVSRCEVDEKQKGVDHGSSNETLSSLEQLKSQVDEELLNGFVRSSQSLTEHGILPSKRMKEWFDLKAYRLLAKAGYDFSKQSGLGKLIPEATEEDTLSDDEATKDEVDEAPLALEDGVHATVDELKEINLGTTEEPRPTFISALFTPAEEEGYLQLLVEYKDVFAWTYKEMPRLNPSIALH
ncbi:hypothetical protein ACB092_05G201600, partial [Castanea dentata]